MTAERRASRQASMERHIAAQQAANPDAAQPDASARMTGAERREARTGRAPSEETPSASEAHATAASDFGQRFAEGLGINSWSWAWSDELSQLQLGRMTPEQQRVAIREYIGENVQPNQLLDAIAGTDPSNQELAQLVETVKANPEMATAFHKAIVQDPTMLERLPTLMNAEGNDNLTLADINTALSHPAFGQEARTQFTAALNEVADNPDLGFDHLLEVANRGRRLLDNSPESFGAFLEMARTNPDELIRSLLAGSGMENTAMGQFLAGMLSSFMPLLVGILDGQNGLFAPWVEAGVNVYDVTRAEGARVFHASAVGADGVTSQFNTEEFNEKFTAAMNRFDRDINNPEHVRAALTEVDPELADEIAELEGDPTLTNRFDASVRSGSTFEQIRDMTRRFYDTAEQTNNVNTGVRAMTPGGTA
jgi:hypothetical protein